jgi:N-acetylglucosamine kinase-like BadF-type ATPase
MTTNRYVIGIDGGGTSTVARLANLGGEVIKHVTGGASNLQTAGPDKCASILHSIVTRICRKAEVNPSSVAMVVYGTAGAGRKPDRDAFYAAIRRKWKNLKSRPSGVHIVGDADIALEAAFGGDPGIIIIAGTGSIIYGRDTDGEIRRSGGWGPIIGDPGSGTALGLKALKILADAFDGCVKAPSLRALAAAHFGIDSPETLIAKVYKEKVHASKLAPLVFDAVSRKERIARRIVEENARELVQMLACGLKKFHFKSSVPVSYVGGLLLSGTVYPRMVTKYIKQLIPEAIVIKPKYPPEQGAIAMAIRLLNSSH